MIKIRKKEKKCKILILINTKTLKLSFVNYKFTYQLYEQQEIKIIKLVKPSKYITFKKKQTKSVIYTLYFSVF